MQSLMKESFEERQRGSITLDSSEMLAITHGKGKEQVGVKVRGGATMKIQLQQKEEEEEGESDSKVDEEYKMNTTRIVLSLVDGVSRLIRLPWGSNTSTYNEQKKRKKCT